MLQKADTNFGFAVAAALGIFFIGGILTTVVPPLIDKTWAKPFSNSDPAKGPTGQLKPYTEQELKGRATATYGTFNTFTFDGGAGLGVLALHVPLLPVEQVDVSHGVVVVRAQLQRLLQVLDIGVDLVDGVGLLLHQAAHDAGEGDLGLAVAEHGDDLLARLARPRRLPVPTRRRGRDRQ